MAGAGFEQLTDDTGKARDGPWLGKDRAVQRDFSPLLLEDSGLEIEVFQKNTRPGLPICVPRIPL